MKRGDEGGMTNFENRNHERLSTYANMHLRLLG
ncbi:hypothetical protein CLU96_4211 [Chryseobacterium sp. 52]|nr:hypothetical protein CLU96_4211 [Chryseobacterium sp. 52]